MISLRLGSYCRLNMKELSAAVSLHPYFKAKPGNMGEIKKLLPAFMSTTANEEANLHYDFTINGDEIFCRESYADAKGILDHLTNVGNLLNQMLTLADLTRLEVHGPSTELDKLRDPLANLKPAWFVQFSDPT